MAQDLCLYILGCWRVTCITFLVYLTPPQLNARSDHPIGIKPRSSILFDHQCHNNIWYLKQARQSRQSSKDNQFSFFFLNATIDECIRLHTNHMNESDSIQMNTRLDDTYAIKATRVTQFMLMLTSFITANDSSSLDILLNAYKTSLMDLTMA